MNQSIEIGTNVVWTPHPGSQTLFLTCPIFECLIEGERGGGKGLLPDELVLTKAGWVKIRDLNIGSVICNPDGSNQSVIGKYHRKNQDMYRVFFHDGTVIDCDGDHIWFAKIANRSKTEKTVRKFRPLDFYGSLFYTKDLCTHLKKYPNRKPLIPCVNPVKLMKRPDYGKIDPYLFGLLLGDGCLSGPDVKFTSVDQELIDYVSENGFKRIADTTSYIVSRESKIYTDIKKFGLLGKLSYDKVVPERLLNGSIDERLSLLQGLMDTDGTVDVDGRCSFCTTSIDLASDVRELVLSLGGTATISEKTPKYTNGDGIKVDGHEAYTLYIQFPNKADLFRLPRKKARCSGHNYMHGHIVRKIDRIEKLQNKADTICIKVNNPNGLFVTRDYVVTHNTEVLLMDFLQHVGQGYGPFWRGIIFRQTYKQLSDIRAKSIRLFSQIFPEAKFNKADYTWIFPDGEELLLRYMDNPEDYWNYHGHEYPFIGWEELTNWPTDECYDSMKSCCRSSRSNMPRKYRSTTNPWGVGHHWVKTYFIDPAPAGTPMEDDLGELRVRLHSKMEENITLMKADPNYRRRLNVSDESKRRAWLHGDWDIQAGGALSDIWDRRIHVIDPFKIPYDWRLDRSFDWGYSKPFSVVWWAESSGGAVETAQGIKHFPRGTLFAISELYGWTGVANKGCKWQPEKIGREIANKEAGLLRQVLKGPADASIFDADRGVSIVDKMSRAYFSDSGGSRMWTKANKKPGSRIAGLQQIRSRLQAAKDESDMPRLYFFNNCIHCIRTLPGLPKDEGNPDDVDTDAEDHCFHPDTEVLTDSGWKHFYDLEGTETVATMDSDYNVEYQKPYEYIERDYNGPLYCYDSKIKFAVTSGHRFPMINQFSHKVKKTDIWNHVAIDDPAMSNVMWVKKTGIYEVPNHIDDFIELPTQENGNSNQVARIDLSTFCKFYGLWLSDGCITKASDTHRKIVVYKMPNDELTEIFESLGYRYHIQTLPGNKACRYSIQSKQLYAYMMSLDGGHHTYEKRIPREILNLPVKYLRSLYAGIILGDGSISAKGYRKFDSTSKQFADDFQELLFKLGMSGNMHEYVNKNEYILDRKIKTKSPVIYRVNVLTQEFAEIHKKKISIVDYVGKVFCVRVPNETLMVRYKGTMFWSSNCYDAIRYRVMKRRTHTVVQEV